MRTLNATRSANSRTLSWEFRGALRCHQLAVRRTRFRRPRSAFRKEYCCASVSRCRRGLQGHQEEANGLRNNGASYRGANIPEEKEFVKGLREVCDDTDTLLIFDEVITGFRLAPGGGQEAFGVIPDLTTFGKAIGGGEFPVGAVGGKTEIMELMSSQKHPKKSECVAQGGTYSGNPLVMRAGYEATKIYEERKLYTHIDGLGAKLMKGLEEVVKDTGANARVTGYGSKSRSIFQSMGPRSPT